MILRAMQQRLYAALAAGPGLNARPHRSRQRVDVMEFRCFLGVDPGTLIARLLAPGARTLDLPARVPAFSRPELPESQWTDEQKAARTAFDRQARLLDKLRDIAADATDYYNDHGEHALFIGLPLVSLPPVNDRQGTRKNRVLAPAVLVPVNLTVRRGLNPGATLELAGDGADLVQPNPALLAWIEQQTGASTEALFADEEGEDPWREVAEVLALAAKSVGLEDSFVFNADTTLIPVPPTDQLPDQPALLPGAVLGLFPLVNPGLLRDTRWMMDQEAGLRTPVKAFLSANALAEPADAAMPPAKEFDHARAAAAAGTDFAAQWLVTQADPCQAEAVVHARHSAALVIHGPPGTGKSQTIANIIGDHLAHGARVLFVCDKRTALDVVKYRLDSMGLGRLCGVIHDPQRDRRDFYLGLREVLDNLAEDAPVPDPARSLARVNERLATLHAELRGCFDSLHGRDREGRSFHELCGEWLALRGRASVDLPEVEGVTIELLRQHRADAEEVVRRAVQARWPESPWRGRLGLTLPQWLATNATTIQAALDAVLAAAASVEQHSAPDLLALDPVIPALEQAAARRELADRLETAARRGLAEVAARLAAARDWRGWLDEVKRLAAERASLAHPLDRELCLQIGTAPPPLAACNRHLLALDDWAAIAARWTRFFAFGKRKAAREALAPLALPLTPDAVERARRFYGGLRARHLWTDLRDRVLGGLSTGLPEDDTLKTFGDGLPELLAVREAAELPANLPALAPADAALTALADRAAPLVVQLRLSAGRADAIAQLEASLTATQLLTSSALTELSAEWRANAAAEPVCRRFADFADTLDPAVRLNDRLRSLPAPLRAALEDTATRGLPWEVTEPGLHAAALARELRQRLRDNPELARMDTQRVEAAFSELAQRAAEKTELVRRRIRNVWQSRWRERLLAGTGSRLNSLGASLRQRLFVRGQKAMKLRQMIAAGAATEGGDPLFDLCPVWMASPATVAQIFPREALFDVIVFDEASQCRLEEALPVLLRGRRVVIAGDPKQLPPTRFFEQALAESDDVAAETAEEVFTQQQAEAEDLLAAALNLNVQEAFLDVHYRSRHEGLIGFSNGAFYGGRLQPIPGHPRHKATRTPIQLVRVDGVYHERGNEAEAKAAAALVAELLAERKPPSIGVACFNLNQRDLILDALEERAGADATFAEQLRAARHRQGRDSFEGLFVKNLENVQGDERDHLIICTTFGPDAEGRFRRNFGALSRHGGERRLNVLVTRAREMVHVLTSIPRAEYTAAEPLDAGQRPTGRPQLYAYLRYAEQLARSLRQRQPGEEALRRDTAVRCEIAPTSTPSPVAENLARQLQARHGVGSTVYWGNEGFCVDLALTHPALPTDVTLGLLTDFTRYPRTPDPIAWEQFRGAILAAQGWQLHRLWTHELFRDPEATLASLLRQHQAAATTGSADHGVGSQGA